LNLQSGFLLAALCLWPGLSGCAAPTTAPTNGPRRFATLDDAYGFLLYKNNMPDSADHRRIAQESSHCEAASFGGRV
jgi:hypothetical protein